MGKNYSFMRVTRHDNARVAIHFLSCFGSTGLLTMLLLLFSTASAFCQRIIWEKSYTRNHVGTFYTPFNEILFLDTVQNETNYFFFGKTSVAPNGSILRNSIIYGKIDQNGDTLFTRYTGHRKDYPIFCKSNSANPYYWFLAEGSNLRDYFARMDTNGRFSRRFNFGVDSLSDSFDYVNYLMGLNDGGFIAIGNLQKYVGTRLATYEHVARYDSTGRRLWWKSFLFSYGACNPNRIESTNRGTFLISGSDGPDIYIHEIDSTGYPISRRVLYTHPQRYGWRQAVVYSNPSGYVVTAREATASGTNGFFGLFNMFYDKIWGGMSRYIHFTPQANSDGTFWIGRGLLGGNNNDYIRVLQDSTISRTISLTSSTTNVNKDFVSILYLGDGSAIFGGSIKSAQTNYNEAFYLCKIDSIGLPFDPTPVVGKVAGGVAVSVYPNPTSGQVQVAGITQATEYEVCTMQGKVLDTGVVHPNGSISLGSYVAGVYFIRVGGGVVKVVRE